MITASRLLVLLAVICFVLAAFHVALPLELVATGLALLGIGILVRHDVAVP